MEIMQLTDVSSAPDDDDEEGSFFGNDSQLNEEKHTENVFSEAQVSTEQ